MGLRGLRRAPTFAASVVLVLTLGIGMAAAMTTVYDAVLRRPLPVRDPDRVVTPRAFDRGGGAELAVRPTELDALRRDLRAFSALAGFDHHGASETPLKAGDRTLVLRRAVVTGTFFDVLGTRALLGRLLRPDDDVRGAPHTLVLSYAAWQRAFGGDPGVVGRQVLEPIGQARYTVVGVAPAGLDYPTGVEYWTPLAPLGAANLSVVGRLAPSGTPAAAAAEFLAASRRLDAARPMHIAPARADAPPLATAIVGDVRPTLALLTAAVALLLAVACVNVGALLLLRAGARARELAVRRALGAGTAALARALATEGVLLGAAGGVLGLACASVLLRVLVVLAPAQLPRLDVIRLAGAPVATAAGVTLLVVLLCGVVPALVAARGAPAAALRADARSGPGTVRAYRTRQALVAAQVALALVLLAGAGLLARSLSRLEGQRLGYTTDHLALLSLSAPYARYGSAAGGYRALAASVLPALRAVPGVAAVTPILTLPFQGTNTYLIPQLVADPASAAEAANVPPTPFEIAGPEYFRTFGIPVLRGRGFVEGDGAPASDAVVVSEALARRLWPGQDPIGRRVYALGDTAGSTVVGMAADAHFRELREATPTIYLPWAQSYWPGLVAVRTDRDLALVLPGLRRALRAVDPDVDLWRARTMDDYLAAPLAQPRLSALLLSAFGLVALALAAIGLYGAMASTVRERLREIGIRLTLGATPARVRGDVLRRALAVVAVGVAIGVVGALAASRALAGLLFEVSPTDPWILGAVCLLLGLVTLAAAYLPARRATRVDPAVTLRAE